MAVAMRLEGWVSVQMPTGERVELWSEGDKLAEASDPGSDWPEMLARQVVYTADEIMSAASQEFFE
jgi:hypothetical protein